MRKIYFFWIIAVLGIVGTAYGTHLLIYHYKLNEGLFVPALVILILGLLALTFFLVAYISITLTSKKKKNEAFPPIEEANIEEEKTEEPVKEEAKPEPSINPAPTPKEEDYVAKSQRNHESYSSYSAPTIYVKQVGYGPLLRIEGNRILDMRNSTYYRVENNMVMQEGYGPVFEIRGNQIRDAFGGYLYELSGNNINKVFGGFYASISGNYITLYDLTIKYEMTDSLSKRQLLVVAALLFEK